MKVLITGFDPFGGATINPAFEAVKLLPDTIQQAKIIKIEIPTVFQKDGEVLENSIKQHNPDIVLCVGQAGGRSGVTIEKVAINLMEARIPDNEGQQPLNQQIYKDGKNAYFATIPVKAMVNNIKAKKFHQVSHILLEPLSVMILCIVYYIWRRKNTLKCVAALFMFLIYQNK